MIGKLVKIAVALLILNGVVRTGSAFWSNYRFEDRLTEIAQFGDRRTEAQLCQEAEEAARILELPVAAEAIRIRRGTNPVFSCGKGYEGVAAARQGGAQKLFIDASYTRDVDIVPGYSHRFAFNPAVEVWARVW
jgi:hypothetical protein